jgi:hypothetical protein
MVWLWPSIGGFLRELIAGFTLDTGFFVFNGNVNAMVDLELKV